MTPEERYEILKKDYILKAESHLLFLNGLGLNEFEEIGMKSILANAQLESITSYSKLVALINEVKIKM